MPDEDSMYCAHKIVNDLNKGKPKPIVSDEDVLLAKYALERKTDIFTLDERSFRTLEIYFQAKLVWDGIYEND